MDWYPKRHGGSKGLRQRWPADRHHGVCDRITHQRHGLAEKKDLCLMAGFRQRVGMQEWKGRLGRIIRAPSALHQHLHGCLMTAVLMLLERTAALAVMTGDHKRDEHKP